MSILHGIQNFLTIVDQNWTTIIVIIGLVVGIVQKVKVYIGKDKETKIETAKAQIREAILKMVSDAEVDYEEWNKAGSIKRSQVIQQIYQEYPVLSKVADQEALTKWIDSTIDESLDTLREIVAQNPKAPNTK